jgi:membrane-associated phospholipid phosphatase
MFKKLFNEFGENGPIILSLLSIYLLWNKNNVLFYYLFGLIIDFILNIVLKGIIQEPRPCFNPREVQLAIKNNKRFFYKNGIPYDLFGMPSGHSEWCLYSTIYVYLVLRKTNVLYLYLIISLITMSQRVVFNHHTIFQVIVGASVGILLGYIIYKFSVNNNKGTIREKPDDNAPI